jgi:isoleucyl-tRNA synthetase
MKETKLRFPPLAQERSSAELEKEVLALWKERDIFRKTVDEKRNAKPFVFFEGPPTANGRPGVHHVIARTVKDLVCRYRTMRGNFVLRRGGWDTHGLPVELEVEKRLGIADKREILKIGIDEFNRQCRESVFTYLTQWRELTERIGFWVDLEDEYVTLENPYIESVWNLLQKIHAKGLLYRGYKVVPYSTKSGTTLSDHEVALGYREVDDPSVFVRFRRRENPAESYLVWTTTPWTLPGNTAIAVHPDVEYARVRAGDDVFLLAKDLVSKVIQGEHEILATMKGASLAGDRYVPLYEFFTRETSSHKSAFTVVTGDFVTTTDGTGVVHQAPAFGAEDLESARRHDLPVIRHVDDEGKFQAETGPFAGQWFKDADKPIVRDLKERGLMVRVETYRHTYPFNWRGNDPLMYVAKDAWYIRTTNIKDRMIELNRTIQWVPEHIRDGRFGDWLANNVDWAISRERFWGTPLPIWMNDRDPSQFEVIGSVAELSEKSGRDLSHLDLHRPAVDEITWKAADGGTMRRIPEVLDVWFDSGAMPFAQWHAPFENQRMAESQFPADFICEGLDQTRGWFYSLHAIAALVKDAAAYRSCVVTGLLMGEDGQKMSKSRGNTVDPWEALGIGGADALRWFFTVTNNPTGTMRFSRAQVAEVSRKILDTVRNLYAFFSQYANLDGFQPGDAQVPHAKRALLDRWILSRLHHLVREVRADLDEYEISRAGRKIEDFVIEDLSNWYVRRSRDRFWAPGFETDKRAAYQTLYESLETVSRLLAPYMPFIADRLYLNLAEPWGGRESVHLAPFPEENAALIDEELERRMDDVRRVVRLGRAARNRANVKTRQPLGRVRIVPSGDRSLGDLVSVVLEELNVKEAELGNAGAAGPELHAKARFDVLGPRFGKDMKSVGAAIAALGTAELERLERTGMISINAAGEPREIRKEEVIITHVDPPGWAMEREGGWSVAIDLAIDEDLRAEGFARELVNKIQFMRKNAGFEITDRIEVSVQTTDALWNAIERHHELICSETLADRLAKESGEGEAREEWQINGEPATLSLRRVVSGVR